MQLPEPTCQQIQIAGYLHDIGKVYIPLSILEKEGELDDEELSQVREHSYMTGELLSDYSELGDIINWASNHHENGRQRLPSASRKGAPDPRRPDYLHRRYFHRADRRSPLS
ncbi:HD domain-containing protein [Klebsiella pneumoniae]|uniref:HD domain-containing protein n=1 Tax=Klebsiella pneumoniae TaxID=573 RepID=A0A3P2EGV0_KLEPN|nr:HD domain-containing protein [Klebsiella pneumoniae]